MTVTRFMPKNNKKWLSVPILVTRRRYPPGSSFLIPSWSSGHTNGPRFVTMATLMAAITNIQHIYSKLKISHKIMCSQMHNIYQTNPAVFIKNLTQHLMFQHCQPIRNHDAEQLQEGNGKINSEKVSGQSSSIQLVHPLYTSMHKIDLIALPSA